SSQAVAGTPLAAILALLVLLLALGLGAVYVATRPRDRLLPVLRPLESESRFVDTDPTLDVDGERTAAAGDLDPTLQRGSVPRARLVIMSHGEQREVPLFDSNTIIGRDEQPGGVIIDDPLASRRHVKISRENNQYWIEDMHSLN